MLNACQNLSTLSSLFTSVSEVNFLTVSLKDSERDMRTSKIIQGMGDCQLLEIWKNC
jgi:hypothetical protein